MIPREREYAYGLYKSTVIRQDENLDAILSYIPMKNGKRRDGVFIKDGKVIRRHIEASNPIWAVIDPILGRTKDENIAWFFAIPIPIISSRRKLLGIKPVFYTQADKIDPLFKYGTDEEISELLDGQIDTYELGTRREFVEQYSTAQD